MHRRSHGVRGRRPTHRRRRATGGGGTGKSTSFGVVYQPPRAPPRLTVARTSELSRGRDHVLLCHERHVLNCNACAGVVVVDKSKFAACDFSVVRERVAPQNANPCRDGATEKNAMGRRVHSCTLHPHAHRTMSQLTYLPTCSGFSLITLITCK